MTIKTENQITENPTPHEAFKELASLPCEYMKQESHSCSPNKPSFFVFLCLYIQNTKPRRFLALSFKEPSKAEEDDQESKQNGGN